MINNLNKNHALTKEMALEEFLTFIGTIARENVINLLKDKTIDIILSLKFRAICSYVMIENVENLIKSKELKNKEIKKT